MVLQGHVENGVVVPDGELSLPDGTEVTIVVRSGSPSSPEAIPPSQKQSYDRALERIDSIANENPGDNLSGADHDRALYGEQS